MPTLPLCSRFRPLGLALTSAVAVLVTSPVPTQAQAPTFNVAEYAEYDENTDAAAASFAADVARRSGAAPAQNAAPSTSASRNRQNALSLPNNPNLTPSSPVASASSQRRANAPKSEAARIWEAFLFGTPNRPVSTPKFAFAQRDAGDGSAVRASRPLPLAAAQSTRPLPSAQTSRPSQTAQPATDEERAAARRRRLQELNALLASRRPEEFSRRLALSRASSGQNVAPVAAAESEIAERFVDDAPALPAFSDEPTVAQRPNVLRRRAKLTRESDAASFDAARANRSKIRQASNLEPAEPLELADDGFAAFVLPTRPNALRLSPNVYLSTELVRLPNAAPLLEATENAQTAQPLQKAQTTENAQTAQPLQKAQTTENAQTAQPLQKAQTTENAQTPATVATPLPAAESSTDVPTLRPTAQFVEPRFLPTSR